jgi:hypothetical protein
MESMKQIIIIFLLIFSSSSTAEVEEAWLRPLLGFEYGGRAVFYHNIQWGENNPQFNYIKSGGQDILVPDWRAYFLLSFGDNHVLEFLYQSIFISTKVVLQEDFQADDIKFTKGDSVDLDYFFPFYRLSYWYKTRSFGSVNYRFGAGLQLRNATITFSSSNGDKRFSTRSLGPVGLLGPGLDWRINERLKFKQDLLGFYLPFSIFGAAGFDLVGWIVESSSVLSIKIHGATDATIALRLLAGGAKGKSNKNRQSGYNFSDNQIFSGALNIGITFGY